MLPGYSLLIPITITLGLHFTQAFNSRDLIKSNELLWFREPRANVFEIFTEQDLGEEEKTCNNLFGVIYKIKSGDCNKSSALNANTLIVSC